jgi:predicted dehydrogenase
MENTSASTAILKTPTERNIEAASNPYVERREQRIQNQRQITYIVLGAGNRGSVYSIYAGENPSLAKIVGVCEPRKYHRESLLKKYGSTIPPENVWTDWTELVKREKVADAAIIATPDILHVGPAIALAQKGYHILLEKPMAISEEDCGLIAKAAQDNNVILAVGHVMRYTPYTQKIKEVVDSGKIGKVMCIQHVEPVGWFHFAHSYVRGNWRREDQATFSLMAKSCHDVDWIRYIMGVPCTRVTSFGSLSYFTKENKPKEAGDAKRCLDCPIQDTCAYSSKKIYLDAVKRGVKGWPVHIICNSEPDIESVTDALKNGPYGRCAYECDNDVCDNQVVNMEFEGGRTASFTMIAFSEEVCVRKTRIYGTQGEINCDGREIRVVDFRDPTHPEVHVPESEFTRSKMAGHGGGDWYLMDSFVAAVANNDPSMILSGPKETLESHLLVFAAENSRRTNTVVETKDITNKYLAK